MSAPRRVLLASLAVASLSCSTTSVLNSTNNFERAADLDFVCLDITAGPSSPTAVHPLTDCGLSPADNGPTGNGALHLHALVTQVSRGELAVVDLATTSGSALVDNNLHVPGYTFIPVGAFPSALLVDQRPSPEPSSVWIASQADRAVRRLPAAAIRQQNRAAFQGPELAVNGGPRDLALRKVVTPEGTRYHLYATVPERSALAAFDVTDPNAPTPLGFIPVTLPPTGGGDAGVDGGTDAGGGAASPVAITVEGERVFVSDERSPYVHVFSGVPLTETGLIELGGPATAMSLTPEVGAREGCDATSDPDHCAAARYLYGIEAGTGHVLVYDLTRNARVRANRVPLSDTPIDTSINSPWPVPYASPASALGLIDLRPRPEADVCLTAGPGSCPSSAGASPSLLRGLFIGVALRNGRLTVVDLDDRDARCRENDCNSNGVVERGNYRFVRHAPRSSLLLDLPPRISTTPSLTRVVVTDNSRTTAGDALDNPAFACGADRTTACAEGANYGVELTRSPGSAAGSSADPYLARNESWAFTFEGTLPGLDLNGGGFQVSGTDLVLLAPGAAFCSRGVLAGGTQFDLVELAGDPTPSTDADAGVRDRCGALFGTASDPRGRELTLAEAWQDRLVIRASGLPTVAWRDGSGTHSERIAAADVRECFRQATRFLVRARRQWVAVGSRSGYQHAVREGAGGRCEEDPARATAAAQRTTTCLTGRVPLADRPASDCPVGRVCMGPFDSADPSVAATSLLARTAPVFGNSYFCLQVLPGTGPGTGGVARVVAPQRDMQFTFAIIGAFEPLRVDSGSLPVSMRFLPTDRSVASPTNVLDRLYVVDTGPNGLIEFRAQPIERVRLFN